MNQEISEIVEKQRDFFKKGETYNINFRIENLKKLRKIVQEYEEKLIEALREDIGKSPFEAYATEIFQFKSELRLHLKNLKKWAKPKKVKTPLVHTFSKSFIIPEPWGVVLVIAPWNFPFNLLFVPLVGAISSGNCVVLKPSNHAPSTVKIMNEMITKAFPPEYIALVQGGREVNQALFKEKFDYIFFTGGTRVGKIFMEKAAQNLTPFTLELGGKCPCIVDREALVFPAARRIIWGKFLNAGQTCVAPDYILADRAIKEELTEALKKYIVEFFGESPEKSPDYARIINEKHYERLCSLLRYGKIIFGGKTNKETLYISPTLMDEIDSESPLMQDEIFGPLLPILEYKTLDEALDFINQRPAPLAVYFFSQNRHKQKMVIDNTSSGGGCINDTLIQNDNKYLPFGGKGESGIGYYHGKASFDTFSHKKSFMVRRGKKEFKLRYPPYRNRLKLLKFIMKFL